MDEARLMWFALIVWPVIIFILLPLGLAVVPWCMGGLPALILWLLHHAHRLKLWPRLGSIGMFIAKHVRFW